MKPVEIHTPLDQQTIENLKSGTMAALSGTIYTARDRAHLEFQKLLKAGKPLPFDPRGQVIYYAGPSPTPPGKVIGAVGPTTSYRMDPFTGIMLEAGIRGFIGKGKRSPLVRKQLVQWGGVYFATYGGAAAFLHTKTVSSELIAFPQLGPEAVYRLEIVNFPLIVVNDIYSGDLYESAILK
ncbi:MAG: FumA C-terminus/TtdB family hydratase beta subunit [Spirochaetota bacterium]